MKWYPRSAWTTSRPGCSTPFSTVKGVCIHYPGGELPADVAAGDRDATAAYLDHTRTGQMSSTKYDYCDIEYSIAVDRAGDAWRLRGLNVRTGANGTAAANAAYPSIFVLVGLHEHNRPTRAQKAAIRKVIRRVRDKYPGADEIHGHREFVATACPGTPLTRLIESGALDPDRYRARRLLAKVRARIDSLRERAARLRRRLR